MERLTERLENGVINVKYASQHETAIHRLVTIEDILGDEYDLNRLRVIMDAEQHGGLIVGYGPGDPGEPGEPGELGVMEEVAADNVVVVRCRECAHYKICDRWENGRRMLCEIHHHSYLGHDGDKNFCSWGQRKEAEHEVS